MITKRRFKCNHNTLLQKYYAGDGEKYCTKKPQIPIICVLSYADYSSINFCNSCREITTLKLELMTSRSKKSPHEGILLNK